MDRSIHRFLCLPIFDETFRVILRQLNLDHVEFWLAMSDDPVDAVDEKLSSFLPALTDDTDIIDQVLVRLDMANILADLISRSASRVQAEIASDLGYGSAETSVIGRKRPAALLTRDVPVPLQHGLPPAGSGTSAVVGSIQQAESSEKRKWGQRLQLIAGRAGDAARINDSSLCQGLQPAEAEKLKSMAFEAGGFRTIRQNVRNWEKFEEFCAGNGLRIYPPTIVAVMKYAAHLRDHGCGPAVLPSFKYAVGWICKRLVMDCPDMSDVRLKALIDKVHEEKGKELKEAVPVP